MMDKKVEILADNVPTVIATDEGEAVEKSTDPAIEPTKKNEEQTPQDERKWFIAVVPPRHEKKISEKLEILKIEAFVATYEQTRVWSRNRKRKVEVIVIPGKLFIYCSEKERRNILDLNIGIMYFYLNIAGKKDKYGRRPLAIIPDKQMMHFKNMLKNSPIPVGFAEYCFVKGDRVRITSGTLKGIEGVARKDSQGKAKLYINIEGLGSASTEVDTSTIEIIK